jgi:hypothetical protein
LPVLSKDRFLKRFLYALFPGLYLSPGY